MIKRLLTFALCLLMLLSVSVFAFAASADFGPGRDPWLERVVDNADILTDSEEQSLSDSISRVMAKYNFDIVILTESSIGGNYPRSYAIEYYDGRDYGCGDSYDGILFLIDMDQRDWYLSPDGIGSEIFTSKKTDAIGQRIVPDLSNGNYYSAFDKLINEIEDALEYNEAHPVKQGGLDRGQVTLFLILTVIGIIIALIIVSSMKRKMKTQQIAVQANNYVRDGSLNMVNAVEVFQYSNVMKTPRQTSTTSSAPRTGSSSVGHSHGGGGGGKF